MRLKFRSFAPVQPATNFALEFRPFISAHNAAGKGHKVG